MFYVIEKQIENLNKLKSKIPKDELKNELGSIFWIVWLGSKKETSFKSFWMYLEIMCSAYLEG